jgi:hypothetical protein
MRDAVPELTRLLRATFQPDQVDEDDNIKIKQTAESCYTIDGQAGEHLYTQCYC